MIYLMRHGLDDETFIGGHSNVDLTDVGIKQVNGAGIWLKSQSFDIREIYTSDVKRAVTTANIINEYLNLNIIKLNKLRELDKGLLTGMKKEDAEVKYPEYIKVNDINMRYPEGESMLDLYLRIKKFLVDISKYDKSILVTHRGVINMIYYLLNNDKLDTNKEKYNVTHASIHEFDIDNRKIRRIR